MVWYSANNETSEQIGTSKVVLQFFDCLSYLLGLVSFQLTDKFCPIYVRKYSMWFRYQ